MNTRPGFNHGAIVKDAYSPSGQSFYAPANHADLPDCEKYKYGTPMMRKGKMVCIDCGHVQINQPTNRPN